MVISSALQMKAEVSKEWTNNRSRTFSNSEIVPIQQHKITFVSNKKIDNFYLKNSLIPFLSNEESSGGGRTENFSLSSCGKTLRVTYNELGSKKAVLERRVSLLIYF